MAEQVSVDDKGHEVKMFMKHFKLEQYCDAMIAEGLEELKDLKDMEQAEMESTAKEDLGIKKKFHIKKFVKACMALKNGEYIPLTKSDLTPSKYHKLGILAVAVTAESGFDNKVVKEDKLAKETEGNLYQIDVHAAMKSLATCGALLQLANAAADGTNCHKHVIVLLSKYATMVKDSCMASSAFVRSSLTALEYHQLALDFAKDGEAKNAFIIVGKCAKVAEEMEKVSENLAERAEQLMKDSLAALSAATDEKTITEKERNKKKVELAKLKEDLELQEKKKKQLEKEMKEREDAEEDAKTEANKERDENRKNANRDLKPMEALGAIFGSDVRPKPNTAAAERYERAIQQKYEKQKEQMAANDALSATLVKLAGATESKDSLDKALASLTVVYQTMGRIKVIFDNTRTFWENVAGNCKKIVETADNVEMIKDMGKIGKVIGEIEKSALYWFVLGKVNYEAKKAILSVDKGMDAILNNLPDEEEALKMVTELAADLQDELQEEKKKIKASADEAKKEEEMLNQKD